MHLKLLICFILLSTPKLLFCQEICNNGIDDNNDGMIDAQDTITCPCGMEEWSKEAIYYVPNVFSPDGNEQNNEFRPIFTCGFDVLNYELNVYDRRGEVLFTSRDFQSGWDGTHGGISVQQGIYPWTIHYTSLFTGEEAVLKGHVGLLR